MDNFFARRGPEDHGKEAAKISEAVAQRRPRACGGAADWRVQRRRSIKTTSTMITIRTMVPMPINMGFLSDRPTLRDRAACAWLGWRWGRGDSLSRAELGRARGPPVSYFLKASLIFLPACLRSPLA